MKKYELTTGTKVINGVELHRIKALKSFGNVEKGELGGWVESEKNLSQYGNAWVGENARVYDDAIVVGNAMVYEDAIVGGHATVRENATVRGAAWVGGKARVGGDAWVGENAIVGGKATVGGKAAVGGKARVGGDTIVGGNATAYGNAEFDGDAEVDGDADYIVFKNWWSSGRFFTWTRSNNKWKVGCFYGSGEELIAKAYKDSEKSGREYERVVKYVNDILKEEEYNDNGNRNKREG